MAEVLWGKIDRKSAGVIVSAKVEGDIPTNHFCTDIRPMIALSFLLGVTAEALRANISSKIVILL